MRGCGQGLRASNRRARHLPMRYETGLPSSVIRFRTWFLIQMCARFSPSRSAAPWEEAADVLVPANQR